MVILKKISWVSPFFLLEVLLVNRGKFGLLGMFHAASTTIPFPDHNLLVAQGPVAWLAFILFK
jgi:hypothetical protein